MALFIVVLAAGALASCTESDVEPIRVGVLHSLTGTMTISESPVVDAILLAIDEINESGWVMGRQIEPVVGRILDSKPDIILNTVNGDSNIAFFRALRQAGITTGQIPTLSFSIAEVELQGMTLTDAAGDYAAWNYFQSLDTSTSQDFVNRFKSKYGDNCVTDDPIEATYTGVHLWADAVEAAGTIETEQVRGQLANRRYSAPQGWIRVDSNNQHLWKYIRVGQIREEGQFNIVWESNVDMRPEPFPGSRSRDEWQAFLDDLYLGWNESWVNPGETPQ
jgi:urea transport system substrate-binding protein